MEIIYNGKKYWLIRLGEQGKQSNHALCTDEHGKTHTIELNISLMGSYIMPPKKKRKHE